MKTSLNFILGSLTALVLGLLAIPAVLFSSLAVPITVPTILAFHTWIPVGILPLVPAIALLIVGSFIISFLVSFFAKTEETTADDEDEAWLKANSTETDVNASNVHNITQTSIPTNTVRSRKSSAGRIIETDFDPLEAAELAEDMMDTDIEIVEPAPVKISNGVPQSEPVEDVSFREEVVGEDGPILTDQNVSPVADDKYSNASSSYSNDDNYSNSGSSYDGGSSSSSDSDSSD